MMPAKSWSQPLHSTKYLSICTSSPPTPGAQSSTSWPTVRRQIPSSQLSPPPDDRMLKLTYFKPVKYQIDTHRESMLSHLQSSSIARRIKIVSFKIHEAVIKGEESRYRAIFSEWVHQFQLELCAMWNRGLESQVMSTHLLNEALELSYLKTILLSNYDMYPYLRYTTPTFLQTVFSDPTLWPDNTITSVSVAHILSSPRCELGNFIVMDTIYAMAYGLPQHVEYDTSITSIPDDSMNFEWAHGCPTEFQIILAQINQCRDRNPNAPDWRDIEHRLITWQSRSNSHHTEWESWMVVAWLAVQETWRHTLLAYLYMAVCGASSDEPRVQFSVSQIFQIAKTIRKPEQPAASIHLFTQYFIAGICARTEKHRLLARHKLSDLSESTHWLIRGTIFVPVLDHLWLGAGAGGQPVKWSDYMLSRETVLPVVV
ncbi:Oleate activated transcription factor 3 [Ceratobasidium theobromae]|uniref:Oleate activated transcription factor 3 n=1 Tax=Ceratobasidium theobromae TaxID=1582974 RepID=A0A5N5QJN3_9AGAM|nr:Oleate activated transcription factor 3 [Ceratobasidium theobromae]